MTTNGVSIPPERARAAQAIAGILQPGGRVALTTHVNADGDGVGSEVALWHLLRARGLRAGIANPTPIPERFDFLLPPGADRSDRAAKEIESADVVIVLDISDLGRLGDLQGAVTHSHAVACIDHHVSPASLPAGPRLVAPEASATAELVFDRPGAPPRYAGRPRWAGGVPALHRRRAPGAPVPPDREWPDQGLVPLDGGGRRGRAGAPVRRRRTPEGGGGVVRGDTGRRAGTGPGSGAGLSAAALGSAHRHRLEIERHAVRHLDAPARPAAEGPHAEVSLLDGKPAAR